MQIRIIIFLISSAIYAQDVKWKTIDNGLELGTYCPVYKSTIGNSEISITRIDPKLYDFNIMHTNTGLTADKWATNNNYSVVVNAGMYDVDGMNMGYMRNKYKVYNNNENKDNAIFAFNPINAHYPLAQIIDKRHQNWGLLKTKYKTLSQSIRMVTKYRENVWSNVPLMWSVVVGAIDKQGNVLFIHCRSPYRMYDFINIILKSPLGIVNMIYLEGGPEASMEINHNGFVKSHIGSYESKFFDDSNTEYWRIPNIIGVTKKK